MRNEIFRNEGGAPVKWMYSRMQSKITFRGDEEYSFPVRPGKVSPFYELYHRPISSIVVNAVKVHDMRQ